MKLNIDKEANALYLSLDDSPIVESEEVVGVEMLYLSKRSSSLILSLLEFETV